VAADAHDQGDGLTAAQSSGLSTIPVVHASCFSAAGVQGSISRPSGEQAMRNRKAAEVKADVEARTVLIEQMTLEQIGVFQRRILTEITNGGIEPREAAAKNKG
jgi:hypothetical protein